MLQIDDENDKYRIAKQGNDSFSLKKEGFKQTEQNISYLILKERQ